MRIKNNADGACESEYHATRTNAFIFCIKVDFFSVLLCSKQTRYIHKHNDYIDIGGNKLFIGVSSHQVVLDKQNVNSKNHTWQSTADQLGWFSSCCSVFVRWNARIAKSLVPPMSWNTSRRWNCPTLSFPCRRQSVLSKDVNIFSPLFCCKAVLQLLVPTFPIRVFRIFLLFICFLSCV